MNDFSIIAEDGINLDDLRNLINRTNKCDGNIPVTLKTYKDDDEKAKEISFLVEENRIVIYNYV